MEHAQKLMAALAPLRPHTALVGIPCHGPGGPKPRIWTTGGSDQEQLKQRLGKLLEHGGVNPLRDLADAEPVTVGGFATMTATTMTRSEVTGTAPGVKIGFQLDAPFPATAAGTVGGFVTKDGSKDLFLLSANHVMAMNGWARNNPREPWAKDPTSIFTNPLSFCYPPKPIARLQSVDMLRGNQQTPFANEDECALARLEGVPDSFEFGFKICGQPRYPKCCDEVKIYTACEGTKVRYGKISAIDCEKDMRYEFGRFHMHKQFLIQGTGQPFAQKGDSGSLIFLHNPGQKDDGTPLGMLYAGSLSDNLFLACPLVDFFQRHKLALAPELPPH